MSGLTRAWWAAGSLLFALTSLYCLGWVFSAASLASGYCGNNFSLFAEALRCRQVHFAMLLTIAFGLACMYCLWRALRRVAP